MSNPLYNILTDKEFEERTKEVKEFLVNHRFKKEEDAELILQSAIKLVKTTSGEE